MRSVVVLFLAALLAACFEPSTEYAGDAERNANENPPQKEVEQAPESLIDEDSMERGKVIMDPEEEEPEEAATDRSSRKG